MAFTAVKIQAIQDIMAIMGTAALFIPYGGGASEAVTVFLDTNTILEPSVTMEALVPVPTPTICVIEASLSRRPIRYDKFQIVSTSVYYTVQAIVNDDGCLLTISVSS
jgi:hypothetical protein